MAGCLEVEVTQGETLEQARANLAEALALYFGDEPGDLSVGNSRGLRGTEPVTVPGSSGH